MHDRYERQREQLDRYNGDTTGRVRLILWIGAVLAAVALVTV